MNPLDLPRAFGGFLDRMVGARQHRRAWVGDGRAHIEVKGIHEPGNESVAQHLEDALRAIKGVQVAEVNAVVGRVMVVFDPDSASMDDLLDVVIGVEESHGLEQEGFPHERPEHPGDSEPIVRNAIAVGADIVGLGASLFGQVLRLAPFPTEAAAIAAVAENQPRVRRFLEHHVGQSATDLGLGVMNAMAQGFSQGPLGLLVDIANRANALGELEARRGVWERLEPGLHPQDNRTPRAASALDARPVAIPRGTVERYTDRSAVASLAAFGAIYLATGSPRRAASALVAGIPKAARLGREGFSAQLTRGLSRHDVLVMDRGAVRRLDRIDAVVFDSAILATGRAEFGEAAALGGTDLARVLRHAEKLFDPARPFRLVGRSGWVLGSLDRLLDSGVIIPRGARARARSLGVGSLGVLGLSHEGWLVGLIAVEAELDPLAIPLASLVKRRGYLLAVAGGRGIGARLGAERTLPGRGRLRSSVRSLQNEGRGVLLVSGEEAHDGLRVADCGIGVVSANQSVPWGAAMLVPGGLADVYRIIDAVDPARRVARQSTLLALVGSGAGGAWAMIGPASTASRRAALPVNVAAMAAQAAGVATALAVGNRPDPVPFAHTRWHAMEAESVLRALDTSLNGLGPAEVQRREMGKPKELPEVAGLARAFVAEFANPLTPVLAAGAALSAAVGSVVDAALVAGVTGANAIVGVIQRVRTETSISGLMRAGVKEVNVRRAGKVVAVEAGRIVRGDILELKAGDVLPVDCRIVESDACEVDESALTGEPYPVFKHSAPVPGASLSDRSCMLYEGTTVVNGGALAVAVATGEDTEIGRTLADAPPAPASGVEARLQRITNATIPVTVASGIAVAGMSMTRGRSMRHAVTSGVSLTVAAVPEGLPLLATVAQLAAARRLASRGALVRNPRTIEALGRVEVLCFDKTGTLTGGQIALHSVSNGISSEEVSSSLNPDLGTVLEASVRASPATNDDEGLVHATDRAVVEGASKAGFSAQVSSNWKRLDELPFEPARGFHAVLGETSEGTGCVSAKGAPEVILSRCTSWRSGFGTIRIDARARHRLNAEIERMAKRGLRVLAVAEKTGIFLEQIDDGQVSGLELLGFLGLADTVRPTAAAAIGDLRKGGVKVVMITGDHPSTAKAIARELEILNGGRLLTGSNLEAMKDDELDAVVSDVTVFARVTPTQKVRIVRSLQRVGCVVAMTGDGANDAPAIRLAHTGIALGTSCSPAARAAADLVVVDDRIETIIDAIIEGRAMWSSVRDSLAILIGGNLGEVAFTLVGTGISGSSPLSARQLLLVNLLTDLMPAMTIALKPPRSRSPEAILNEGPDASLGSSLVRQIAVRAVATSGGALGAWAIARFTGTRRHADTVALAALVGSQLGQTAVLGRTSPLVLASTVASGAVLVAVIETPVVSQFFGCTPLGPSGWMIATGMACAATGASVVMSSLVSRPIHSLE